MGRRSFWKRKPTSEDREKMDRLERAEKDLGNLQHRKHMAVEYLSGRQGRNHWRESVAAMIGGNQRD